MLEYDLYRFLRHPQIRVLTCSELGFLVRLIDYSAELSPDGFPDDDAWRRHAGGPLCSRYRAKRLWPVLKKFFNCTGGRCFYVGPPLGPSEEKLRAVKLKRRAAGIIGARARWGQSTNMGGTQ
jgi:hypothetical protein